MNDHETLSAITARLLARFTLRSEQFHLQLAAAPRKKPCPICGGPSELNEDKSTNSFEFQYTCHACASAQAIEAKRAHWRRCGIPVDVQHATLYNFKPSPSPERSSDSPGKFLGAAKDFINGTTRNLIFAGTPGIGKGHLAASIAKERIDRLGPYAVQWWTMHKLFEASHRAYEDGNRQRIIDQLCSTNLLILDEIAMAATPSDGEKLLYDIINGRHQASLQTIFLSNKSAEQIRNWLGPAATDRLRSGGVRFLWGEWPSARGSKIEGGEF